MADMNTQQFLRLETGKKYTMWWFGNFGFPTCLHIKIVKVECRKYAQYDKSIQLQFLKKGGRRVCELNFIPGEAVMIWDGWINVNSEMNSPGVDQGNGITISRSKFASYDRQYMQVALDSVSVAPVVEQQ